MLRTSLVAAGALFWTNAALADGAEGRACRTSDECGELHCIDGACTPVVNGHAVRPARRSVGEAAMFGSGDGYTAAMAVGDLLATAMGGALVAVAFSTRSAVVGIAAGFPTALTGPLIHFAYGRPVPAIVSFFAWAALPPTALVVGLLVGFSGGVGSADQSFVAVATGTAVSVAGAVGLTALDMYFARAVRRRDDHPSSFTWAPAIAPTRTGFTASIVGAF